MEGDRLYNAEEVRELSEIFDRTRTLYSKMSATDLDLENQIVKLRYPTNTSFLDLGANYNVAETCKATIEETETAVLEARKVFEKCEEDLTLIYGADKVESNKKLLYGDLDKEYEKFSAFVEEYEELIGGPYFEHLFETYKEYKERVSQRISNEPVTDEVIKKDLLDFGVIIPVSEGSEELKIAKPYENIEGLEYYL